MKQVYIIVPQGDFILSSVVGTYKVLNAANAYMVKNGLDPLYKINLVGVTNSSSIYGGLFSVHPDTELSETHQADLIFIPASQPQELPQNTAFVPWIKEQYKQGSEIASLCVGAFMLAETGLINGKQCSTHWLVADQFKAMYPEVELMPEKIVTDENGIYTSGGAYSFLNLVLYLVEKHAGREVAVYLSKLMEIELQRESQSLYFIFEGQKDHNDEPIRKAQFFIENNVGEKISVEQLASLFAISRRNFERRFRKATSNSPAEYLQRVKVEAAKRKLENGTDNVNEVMYAVGYTDSKAFRTIFKKYTGLSPQDYRKKYSRQAVDTILD